MRIIIYICRQADFAKLRSSDGLILATQENGFELVAQVFPNDYIKITYEDRTVEGYYTKYGVTGGTISLMGHSQVSKNDMDLLHCSVGTALSVEVYNISVLGDNYKFE